MLSQPPTSTQPEAGLDTVLGGARLQSCRKVSGTDLALATTVS